MIKSKVTAIFASLLMIPLLFLGACNDSGSNLGSLEIMLYDQPIDSADAVNVKVDRVEINRLDSDTGWTVLSRPNQVFDLMQLTNGNMEVLSDTMLPAGRYEQIRLILSQEGHSVVAGDNIYDMFVPSGFQTGVKLEVNTVIEEGIETVILLDFDASRSVVDAGASQAVPYLLQPVIKATIQAETGNIGGVVSPEDARSVVQAIQNSEVMASAIADTVDGSFKLVGLEEGTYRVRVDPRDDSYSSTEISGVSVTLGETNDIGTIDVTN